MGKAPSEWTIALRPLNPSWAIMLHFRTIRSPFLGGQKGLFGRKTKRASRLRILPQAVGRVGHPDCFPVSPRLMTAKFAAPHRDTRLFTLGFSPAVTHTAQSAARHRTPLPRHRLNLRLILGITLLLLGFGSLSCQVKNSVGQGPIVTPAAQWVRTIDGWERKDLWHAPELHVPRLHPLVVAAGQGLVSVMGLVTFRRNDKSVA
jgi:hypothetical protein